MTSRPSLTFSPRSRRSRRRGSRGGQGLVEFALVAPVFLMVLFLLVDFGRALYAYSGLSNAAREGARILSLASDRYTDCYALTQMEKVGQGYPLDPDPASQAGDADPHTTPAPMTQPSTGVGLIYIYPAVQSAVGCTGQSTAPRSPVPVSVSILYHFQPLTPFVSTLVPNLTMQIISVVKPEYQH